jgi:hypothetical protein
MPTDLNFDLLVIVAACLLRYLPIAIKLLLDQFEKRTPWIKIVIVGIGLVLSIGLEVYTSNFQIDKVLVENTLLENSCEEV